MDDLNLFHILAHKTEQIGHGVRLCAQDDVHSGTLVCFLDRSGALHFGFGYRNGSNLRVVCWEGTPPRRRNKTVPKGALIIAFDNETTPNSFRDKFNANNFGFTAAWFKIGAQKNVRDELRALNDKQDKVADLTARIAGLTIDQLDEVIQKIDELQGNN